MKKLLLWLMLVSAVWAKPDSLIPPDPEYTNGFALSNPGYRKRAADRYEKNYFLYGNDDFLHENLQIVNTTMDICRKLTAGDSAAGRSG